MGKVDRKRNKEGQNRKMWRKLVHKRRYVKYEDGRHKMQCEVQFPSNLMLGGKVVQMKPRKIRHRYRVPHFDVEL